MNKLIIVGGGPSIRWDAVNAWDGDIYSCDVVASDFNFREPTKIFTLEDGENMFCMFSPMQNSGLEVVTSKRTKPSLIKQLQEWDYKVTPFDIDMTDLVYNVGMFAWFYAWSQKGYKEIYLTGFDHLTNPNPSLIELLWRETFHEFRQLFAPKDLKTYIIGNRREYLQYDGLPTFNTEAQYYEYRMKRDAQILSRFIGNKAEPLNETLIQ